MSRLRSLSTFFSSLLVRSSRLMASSAVVWSAMMVAGADAATSGSSTKSTPAIFEMASRICTTGCDLKFSETGLRKASASLGRAEARCAWARIRVARSARPARSPAAPAGCG